MDIIIDTQGEKNLLNKNSLIDSENEDDDDDDEDDDELLGEKTISDFSKRNVSIILT